MFSSDECVLVIRLYAGLCTVVKHSTVLTSNMKFTSNYN